MSVVLPLVMTMLGAMNGCGPSMRIGLPMLNRQGNFKVGMGESAYRVGFGDELFHFSWGKLNISM